MLYRRIQVSWPRLRSWLPAVVLSAALLAIAVAPAPLVAIARGYAALCERLPVLTLLTSHTPAQPLTLLLSLIVLAFIIGSGSAIVGVFATVRCSRYLRRCTVPAPARLARIAGGLGLTARLTYVAAPEPMACCYGLLRPHVAVTAGLVDRLDDEALAAVLGHERQHQRRRDPLRHLALDALMAAAFLFPVARALRQRAEVRIELAADRAALAIAPRDALATALLAALAASPARLTGVAGLTATEARIAQLAGRATLPPIPPEAAVGSFGIAALIVLATIDLAAAADMVRMMCPFCSWLP